MRKILFVLGGEFSDIGKSLIASSFGYLFKKNNLKPLILKLDYYLNISSKFIDPSENGEVFVTQDGKEVDFDIAHYERFLNQNQSSKQSITLGLVLKDIAKMENKNKFKGVKIDFVNEVFNKFKYKIEFLINKIQPEITIIELGGNVENPSYDIFVEILKKFKNNFETLNCLVLKGDEESIVKEKKAINFFNSKNIKMDLCILRSDEPKCKDIKVFENSKTFCLENVYFDFEIVQKLLDYKIFELVLQKFDLKENLDKTLIDDYKEKYKLMNKSKKSLNFLIVDQDAANNKNAYYSIIFSLKQSGLKHGIKVNTLNYLPQEFEKTKDYAFLKKYDGILSPGGFGDIGFDGKILITKYARENNIPFLSICYGMQILTIEYFRNVLNIQANTSEISKCCDDVLIIDYLNEYKNISLGEIKVKPKKGSLIEEIYKTKFCDLNCIYERRRHSFIFQNKFKKVLEDRDDNLILSGVSNDSEGIPLCFELKKHPFFLGLQFHPELSTKLDNSHPVFDYFVKKVWEIKTK